MWRELQAASRRGSTRHLRLWTAALGLGVGLVTFLMLQVARMAGGSGSNHFFVFAGYTLFICLVMGLFLTADSIGQERREGTLGLLFLSGLGAWDVLAGKLLATSVAAAYAVLGLIPLMAIPVLGGGVTGGELIRVALAVGNSLWFAVTLGLLTSVAMRDTARSMVVAMGTMLALSVGEVWWWRGVPILSDLVPITPFLHAGHSVHAANPAAFWQALAVSHALGWVLFLLAGLVLRASWQTGELRVPWPQGAARFRWLRPSRRVRSAVTDPIARLSHPGYYWARAPWLVVLLGGIPVLLMSNVIVQVPFAHVGFAPAAFVLKVLLAHQACRFFVEARRNGTLELILGTPLTDQEILAGHWRLLRSVFAAPILLYVGLNLLLGSASLFGQAMGFLLVSVVFSVGSFLVGCLAAAWVGTWLALTMRKPQFAFGATVLLVLILPTMLCGLGVISNLILLGVAASRLATGVRSLARKGQAV